ncbi:MAG TPA: ABC transporter ATP-binding protein [Vicinamibacteria bacterium]|nr:ABC transporter ATP-binding protein [Vicinamibacteria bacterium]
MSAGHVVFEDVSKFYGEVLGVNRVTLTLPPGVTSLVGPNGAGKTTLMNLMTGLVQPSRGRVSVLGTDPRDPEVLGRRVGYCTQFDSFPRGVTGRGFVSDWLRLHGRPAGEADGLAAEALERVGMTEAAGRKVAAYSKGMRQRVRLALALSHRPEVLVLDEPLNGLDPMARAESIALFQALGQEGLHVVISSHILHEVDRISDHVVLLSHGYVVAEGRIHDVRTEVTDHPMQILVRCSRPHDLAAGLFAADHVVEVRVHSDGGGVLVRTRDASAFHRLLNQVVLERGLDLEAVAPADDDVGSVYQYLIGSDSEAV